MLFRDLRSFLTDLYIDGFYRNITHSCTLYKFPHYSHPIYVSSFLVWVWMNSHAFPLLAALLAAIPGDLDWPTMFTFAIARLHRFTCT